RRRDAAGRRLFRRRRAHHLRLRLSLRGWWRGRLVDVRTANLHGPRWVRQRHEAVSAVKRMGVAGGQAPAPQLLELGVSHDGRHQRIGDATPPVALDDEDVAYPGEG